jgi:hypothetical protein
METLAFENEHTKNSFLRISKEWIGIAHESTVSYEFAYDAIMTMKTERVQPEGIDVFLQNVVDQNVSWGKDDKKKKPGQPTYTFPGPMAVQMSRRNINTLLNNTYWVTEKSDGIRTMMLTIHEKNFPCWKIQNDKKVTTRLNIFDNCAVDYAYRFCQRDNQDNVFLELSSGGFTFYMSPLRLVNEETSEVLELIQSTGRSFSYVFDRKYQFYLCVDEFLFPTHSYCSATQPLLKTDRTKIQEVPIQYQKLLICDGEIVWNIIEARFNYSIYDLVSFCRTNDRIDSCLKMRMQERMSCISMIVNDYYYFSAEIDRTPRAKSLKVICKHFYPMKNIKDVLNCIEYDATTHQYLYKKYNRNDGLVFTPDDPKLYKFQPGKCDNLLKWKWPDKLSIDFLVKRNKENYSMFYSSGKEATSIVEYKQTVLDWGDISPIETQGIAELVYQKEKSTWKVLCIRYDKSTGNSFPVMTTTLENMMENITREEIGDLTPNQLTIDKKYIDSILNYGLYLTFKVEFNDRTRSWCLRYHFKGDRGANWQWYHSIHYCIGPKDQIGPDLVALCEMMSRGGKDMLVRCVFLPDLGYYKIIDFAGIQEDTNSNTFLATLEKLTGLQGHKKKRKSRNFEDDSEESGIE